MITTKLSDIKPARYRIEVLHPKLPTSIKGQYRLFADRLNIEAKPTIYQGHQFRSRLEARWCVFFDSLKIKWRYEAAAFDLGFATINGKQVYLGGYLPDLYLPDYEAWIEIKPIIPNQDSIEWAKVRRLVKHICQGASGFIFARLPQTAFVYGNSEALLPITNHSQFKNAVRQAENHKFSDSLK